MALIECPECSKEVSDKANACPNCGFPFNKEEKVKYIYKEPEVDVLREKEVRVLLKKALPKILLLCIVGITIAEYNDIFSGVYLHSFEDWFILVMTILIMIPLFLITFARALKMNPNIKNYFPFNWRLLKKKGTN